MGSDVVQDGKHANLNKAYSLLPLRYPGLIVGEHGADRRFLSFDVRIKNKEEECFVRMRGKSTT